MISSIDVSAKPRSAKSPRATSTSNWRVASAWRSLSVLTATCQIVQTDYRSVTDHRSVEGGGRGGNMPRAETNVRATEQRPSALPPGQRAVDGFPRFGTYLHRPPPEVPADPAIEITGAVNEPFRVPL